MPATPSHTLSRPAGRAADALRPVRIQTEALKFAEGSALIEVGDTRVLVAASVEERVPPFLKDSGRGWLTAEYSMLPRATSTRSQREVTQGRPSGRTAEIQRLIGRSLRAVVDLAAFPDRTVVVDCDVLQADGGTRTAAITGAYVAVSLAFARLLLTGDISAWPIEQSLAAVSVGLVDGRPVLDLEYVEDQVAEVDMNVVGTAAGKLVEIQATAEKHPFSRRQFDQLLGLAFRGIEELARLQGQALAPALEEVQAALARKGRPRARPKDEADLWGEPPR